MNTHTTTTRVSPLTTHPLDKRGLKESPAYDYDEFLNEYYEETLYEDRLNETYHPIAVQPSPYLHLLKKLVSMDIASSPRDANGVGLKAVHRLFVDYKNQQCPNKELSDRLWKMLKIWFFIYLVVAVPVWSTTGWCCCCLCCKFFKPQKTIEEAKLYLIQNPPGILKTRKGQTLYEPTDNERECYAEFEHLISII
ncbi:uncharacterized protein LOC126374810 isoform X2 [Pectinophora gossypiella]|uniref:uncharacterized protein LOC126374810 isoform X2 n=1 Tax=Pectinophora gossypiella TaxID=13191 RepID=UPI00214F1829|nr:uncharacterized protein LOC126374810 isoform X2 [Pectinophora gossypiella]